MYISAIRPVFENTTVRLLIAKNATQAMGSGCSILLLMSWRVQFDIYAQPADANESQFEPKKEGTCSGNLICAHNWTAGLKTHRFPV